MKFKAKYRLLSKEELEELEQEFIEYLILNGIASDDWLNIKKENQEEAEHIVMLFSDVVFEKIMRNVNYLEWRSSKEIKVLHCLKEKLVLVGLNASEIQEANLEDAVYMNSAIKNPPLHLKVYTKDIPYESSREEEIFKMTVLGFHIADGALYKTLCMVLPS